MVLSFHEQERLKVHSKNSRLLTALSSDRLPIYCQIKTVGRPVNCQYIIRIEFVMLSL